MVRPRAPAAKGHGQGHRPGVRAYPTALTSPPLATRRTRAHAASVAPVVTTSSTRIARRGATIPGWTTTLPRTPASRWALFRPTWVRALPVRRRQSATRRPVRRDRAASYGIPVEQLQAHYAGRNLLRVQVTADDVAEAVLWLSTDRSAKTTGAMIPVDGGLREAFPR